MADAHYAKLLRTLLEQGTRVQTRNATVRRLFHWSCHFARTPLVCLRKTAWKNALREWEFFMRGSIHLDHLHADVRHWWEPFCTTTPKALLYSYGNSLRRLYAPSKATVIPVARRHSSEPPVEVRHAQIDPYSAGERGPLTGSEMRTNSGQSFVVLDVVGRRRSNRVYRIQFTATGHVMTCRGDVIQNGGVKDRYEHVLYGTGCIGEPDRKSPMWVRAKQKWDHMMQRCYDPSVDGYSGYGAVGVRVSERWHCFASYLNDLPKLPGYAEWLRSPTDYHLDKDYYGAKVYGTDTCVFLPVAWNTSLSKSTGKFSVYRESELIQEFLTARDMHRFFGLRGYSSRGVERLGYRVEYTPNTEDIVYRYKLLVDQVQDLIDGIRDHPYSRRNAITTWIPDHVYSGLMNPTNCHGTVIQAFVQPDNSLHLVTYQRSSDVMVGLGANWIQYWAFLMWLASRTGREVGTLTWIGGDVHLYDEHEELARRVLEGEPKPGPSLVYEPSGEEFVADDFYLDDLYMPDNTERARMVV